MVNLWLVIPITAVAGFLGIAIGYLIYTWSRPKKMTWDAKIYQLGDGVIPPPKDENGKIISNIELRDLRPYTKDVLERVERGKGITLYRLVKLNRTTPQVTGDCIEFWGGKKREVSVLIESESCTLLKKGYDKAGFKVFRPVPYDRLNMVKNEMAIRKDRIHKERDILQAVLPYVAIALAFVMLISVTWLVVKGLVDINKQQSESLLDLDERMEERQEDFERQLNQLNNIYKIIEPGVPPPPPSIDPD